MARRTLDWSLDIGQQTRVYRNLQNGTMSLQQRVDGRWKVVGHVREAVLRHVTFHLNEAGRQRVIAQRQKNVHAWAEGVLVGESCPGFDAPIDLAYNPYRDRTFVERQTLKPLSGCEYLIILDNRVYVSRNALIQTPATVATLSLFGDAHKRVVSDRGAAGWLVDGSQAA